MREPITLIDHIITDIVIPLRDEKRIIDEAKVIPRPKWGVDLYLYKDNDIFNFPLTYGTKIEDLKEIGNLIEKRILISKRMQEKVRQ